MNVSLLKTYYADCTVSDDFKSTKVGFKITEVEPGLK